MEKSEIGNLKSERFATFFHETQRLFECVKDLGASEDTPHDKFIRLSIIGHLQAARMLMSGFTIDKALAVEASWHELADGALKGDSASA